MNIRFLPLIFFACISCSEPDDDNNYSSSFEDVRIDTIVKIERDTVYLEKVNKNTTSPYFIYERLPWWFNETELLSMEDLSFKGKYQFDNRLNPMYLESDFNGDKILDLAIPILEKKSNKLGIAIIHGGTNKTYIVGAGHQIAEGFTDDMAYMGIWRINRKKENEPGIDATEPLVIQNNSISIEASEIGGGLIYWNGKAYQYFHQSC
jgi:hypothetical protein